MDYESITGDMELPATFRYSAFYDLLADAVFQHRLAKVEEDSYRMNRYARASILAAALSVECAGNCMLSSMDLPQALHSELDRLAPMAKIEVFLRLRSVSGFDRGADQVQRVVELIKARNDHVHPKTSAMPASVNKLQDGGGNWILPFSIEGDNWKQLKIPKKSMFWSSDSSLSVLRATANFYAYIFCDLLKFEEDEFHSMLPSRLEIGDAHLLTVFDEIREELRGAGAYGVDFSFFHLFEQSASQDPSNPSFKRTPGGTA